MDDIVTVLIQARIPRIGNQVVHEETTEVIVADIPKIYQEWRKAYGTWSEITFKFPEIQEKSNG